MGWAQIISAILSIGMDLVNNITKQVPGPMEGKYRQMAKDTIEQIASGHGGMAEGERQRMMSDLSDSIRNQQAEQMAAALRGSSPEAGESGLAALQQGLINQGAANALRGGMSDIRAQDLALAEQRRQDAVRMMENAVAWSQQRKGFTASTAPANYQGGFDKNAYSAGAQNRDTTGADIRGATANINGGSSSDTSRTAAPAASSSKSAAPTGGNSYASTSTSTPVK